MNQRPIKRPKKKWSMNIIALLYAEFKQREEELKHSQGIKKWDEKTHHYYLMLKHIFHDRK